MLNGNPGPSPLAARVRKLRVRQGWTLQRLADACGVTRSLLSKIENGRAAPSVATLTRLAAALGVPVSALLEEGGEATTVVARPGRGRGNGWTSTDKGYRFRPLCAERVEKLMQPLLFVAERGKVRGGALRHGGEEFIYVLEGRMRYRVGRSTHELGPGDALYFDAEEPHDLQPMTAMVKYLAVLAAPPQTRDAPPRRTPARTTKRVARRTKATRP
jgi:transcriptional regulator with XRE-family HTH domain